MSATYLSIFVKEHKVFLLEIGDLPKRYENLDCNGAVVYGAMPM